MCEPQVEDMAHRPPWVPFRVGSSIHYSHFPLSLSTLT